MPIRDTCMRFYWRVQKRLVPDLRYSQYAYEEMLERVVEEGAAWLDVGCGHEILPSWRLEQEQKLAQRSRILVGIDRDLPSLLKHKSLSSRVVGDIAQLPFREGSFDLVTSNMVFEHLEKPDVQLREIARVISPRGLLLFHTPNAHGYSTILARAIPEAIKRKVIYFLQRRVEDDVFRTHYRINTPFEISRLAEGSGLAVEELHLIPSSAQLVMLPPLVLLELLWIKLTMLPSMRHLRTNLIVLMRKVSA
ncbi:MAG: class I SAM-dependent methyltransferase [Candidatus Eisenbacteria bacterium]|nr:class I SAM-dependent methyltransferase [Candidatus Eisenbacteria bacterium]